jgi:hypothetical protein
MGVPPFLVIGLTTRWYPFSFPDTRYDTLSAKKEPLPPKNKKDTIKGRVRTMVEKPERRETIRVRSLNFINIDTGKENPVTYGLGRTLELNVEGATLEIADKLSVGVFIEVELAMGDVITTLKGEVKNVQPSASESGLYRVGIQFLKPNTVHLE